MSKYIELGLIATSVSKITGNITDGATAAGYSAWIESITGQLPQVVPVGKNKVKLVLTESQVKLMRRWIDEQIAESVKKKNSQLEIEFGPVIMPILTNYAIIYGLISMGVGILLTKIFWNR